jgi:hypothetical protein
MGVCPAVAPERFAAGVAGVAGVSGAAGGVELVRVCGADSAVGVARVADSAADPVDGGASDGGPSDDRASDDRAPDDRVPDASPADAEEAFADDDFFVDAARDFFAPALSPDAAVPADSAVPVGASNGSSGDSAAGGLAAREVVFLAGRRARFLAGWSEEVASAGVGGWFSSLTKVLLRTGRGSGRWFHSWVTGFAA